MQKIPFTKFRLFLTDNKVVTMPIFKIKIFNCLMLICYSYGHEYPLASYEKRIPNFVQLPYPEELAKFLDGQTLHQQNRNSLQEKEKRDSRREEKSHSIFNNLKSFLSQIECFKSHWKFESEIGF